MKSILFALLFVISAPFPLTATHAATFKFRLLAEPTTFDWHQASTSIETPLMMNLMEGLME